MPEPAQKWENNYAIFKQNYTKNGLILLFQLLGKSRISRFPLKKVL